MSSLPLKRSLSPLLVMFYGLGTMLGAGVYVLVGKVAAHAGVYTPLAFLVAALIAFFTAVSYAELSARFPKSAGEAFYVQQAFHSQWLSGIVGWLVVMTGVVSAAAMTRGFVGYFQLFLPASPAIVMLLLIIFLGAVAIWGIKESALMVLFITLLEVGGLLIIIILAGNTFNELPVMWHTAPRLDMQVFSGVLSGAFIAFYAYIGFEDMVNIAEEVKYPEKSLPPAIFWALGLATLLYILVALAMQLTLPLATLSQSSAPLADFIQTKGFSPSLIGFISIIAILNGALAQIIMASRVLYGMAHQNTAPQMLGRIHPKTQTPTVATLFLLVVIYLLSLCFDVEWLAGLTSFVILCVFSLVNLSLLRIKRVQLKKAAVVSYSTVFPVLGSLLSIFFLVAILLM